MPLSVQRKGCYAYVSRTADTWPTSSPGRAPQTPLWWGHRRSNVDTGAASTLHRSQTHCSLTPALMLLVLPLQQWLVQARQCKAYRCQVVHFPHSPSLKEKFQYQCMWGTFSQEADNASRIKSLDRSRHHARLRCGPAADASIARHQELTRLRRSSCEPG